MAGREAHHAGRIGASQEYAEHLSRYRGNPPATIDKKLAHVGKLSAHLAGRDKTWSTMALTDIDGFLVDARSDMHVTPCRYRLWRPFLRPLPARHGAHSSDLAESVIAPVQPKFERPRPALPWEDVQRLLRRWTPPRHGGCATTRSC